MNTTSLLIVFVKFPEPGRVKTRLAQSVGNEEATRIYRRLVTQVASNVMPPGGEGGNWEIWPVFDPEERETELREWLEPLFGGTATRYLPQVSGDLGARMGAAFAEGFAAGFQKVAAIGTDCVDLDIAGIQACWETLDVTDVVFGPAEDGGYYLLGLKRDCPQLFEGVPWSDERTLEVSKEKAVAAGLSIEELEVLSDVDEIEQWNAVREKLADA